MFLFKKKKKEKYLNSKKYIFISSFHKKRNAMEYSALLSLIYDGAINRLNIYHRNFYLKYLLYDIQTI